MYLYITNIVTPKTCSAQLPCLYHSFFHWAATSVDCTALSSIYYRCSKKALSDVIKYWLFLQPWCGINSSWS